MSCDRVNCCVLLGFLFYVKLSAFVGLLGLVGGLFAYVGWVDLLYECWVWVVCNHEHALWWVYDF